MASSHRKKSEFLLFISSLFLLSVTGAASTFADSLKIKSGQPIQLAWWDGYYRGGFYQGRYYRPGYRVYDLHSGPVIWTPRYQQRQVSCQRECAVGSLGRGVHCVQRCF